MSKTGCLCGSRYFLAAIWSPSLPAEINSSMLRCVCCQRLATDTASLRLASTNLISARVASSPPPSAYRLAQLRFLLPPSIMQTALCRSNNCPGTTYSYDSDSKQSPTPEKLRWRVISGTKHRQARANPPRFCRTDFRHPSILLSLILGSNRRLRFSAFLPVDRDKKSDELRFSGVALRYAQEAFGVLPGPFQIADLGRRVIGGNNGVGSALGGLVADLNQIIPVGVGPFIGCFLTSIGARVRDIGVPLQDSGGPVAGLSV